MPPLHHAGFSYGYLGQKLARFLRIRMFGSLMRQVGARGLEVGFRSKE